MKIMVREMNDQWVEYERWFDGYPPSKINRISRTEFEEKMKNRHELEIVEYAPAKMEYLASPYTDADLAVRQWRYEQAMAAVAKLVVEGRVVFSPILHCHPMAVKYGLHGNFHFWRTYCLTTLGQCSRIIFLKLPGWAQSEGVKAEFQEAMRLKIEVQLMEPISDGGGPNGGIKSL